jgi:hypothetical protein
MADENAHDGPDADDHAAVTSKGELVGVAVLILAGAIGCIVELAVATDETDQLREVFLAGLAAAVLACASLIAAVERRRRTIFEAELVIGRLEDLADRARAEALTSPAMGRLRSEKFRAEVANADRTLRAAGAYEKAKSLNVLYTRLADDFDLPQLGGARD